MASKTDIANLAIAHHGGDWVDDIEAAPGAHAEAIRAMWTPVLEIALAAHPWKFAKKTWFNVAALPADENPDPDRSAAFRLPSDCVRCFETRPKGEFDEWEGGIITSNAGSIITMVGTRRGVEVGRFSAYFNAYLGALLAHWISNKVAASEAIRERVKKDMATALAEAKSDNGRAGTVRNPLPDTFVTARLGGGGWR